MSFHLPRPVYAPDPPGGGDQQQQQQNQNQNQQQQQTVMGDALKNQQQDNNQQQQQQITTLPDTWREIMAGGDADILTELKRYPTYGDAAKNILSLKKAARTGSIDAEPMPDVGDGKDPAKVEALKTWREKHGVPAEASGYVIPEATQKRLTDLDKPMLESFTEAAHKAGQPQKIVDFATAWYVDAMEAEAQREADGDKKDATATEDTLRGNWGTDYRKNLDFASKTAALLLGDEGVRAAFGGTIFDARLPNGTKLGSIPAFVEGMLKVGLAIYGDGTLVGDEAIKATGARKAEIEAIMATDMDRYRREGLDKEYRSILDAEERAGKLPGR